MDRDAEHIKQFLANGDKKAFGNLMTKYKDQVFNFCYAWLGNYEDADDCTQEIFIKAFENLGSFRFDSKFSTWLYRLMVNHCKNTVKTKYYRQKQLTNGADALQHHRTTDILSPEKITLNKEMEELVYSAINLLKGIQKTVLILRDIDGKNYDEIAEITHLKSGTVKSTLARARYKVAEILKKQNL